MFSKIVKYSKFTDSQGKIENSLKEKGWWNRELSKMFPFDFIPPPPRSKFIEGKNLSKDFYLIIHFYVRYHS